MAKKITMIKVGEFSLIFFITVFCHCVEPFNPQLDKYEKVFVVDALLTNSHEDCYVKLSQSIAHYSHSITGESNAKVIIIDENGNEEIFTETDAGVYKPQNIEFAGQPKKKYKLHIQTDENQIIESEYLTLPTPSPIDSLFFKLKNKFIANTGKEEFGAQIYLNVKNPAQNANYYAWEFIETWAFSVPYISNNRPGVAVCYQSSRSKEFILDNSLQSDNNQIIEFPLQFVSIETPKLSRAYSILVKQYVIDEISYNFLKNLKTNNETSGSLFDPTPLMIEGNITSSGNQAVMGLFQVAGVTKQRTFINRRFDIPINVYVSQGFEDCKIWIGGDPDEMRRNGRMIMDTTWEGIRYVNFEACFDCTKSGTLEKPDFWIY